MSRPAKQARIQRKRIGLTWPKTDGEKSELMQHLVTTLGKYNVLYALVCKEKHADGTSHFHAFVLLEKRVRVRNLSAFDFNGRHANIEEIQNMNNWINYLKKDGDWIECGNNPVKQEKMNRAEKVKFLLSHTIDECIETSQFSVFEIARKEQLEMMKRHERWIWPAKGIKRDVKWFYGDTGTGKTQRALEIADRYYRDDWVILTGDMKTFMNGYTHQRCVIFDDFRPGCLRFERLLHLLDMYRVIVNIKGGYTEWLAECIIITAPVHPREMFVNRDTKEPWDGIEQLIRRIDEITEFPNEPPTAIFFPGLPEVGPHDVPWLPTEEVRSPDGVESMESVISCSPINAAQPLNSL